MEVSWNWLRGNFDDPIDAKTFAALKIGLSGEILTRVYDRIAEGERDTVNVVLYPLALSIAENWWPLLYEPKKSDENGAVSARHSLDTYLPGFIFPALTIWSGGEDSILVEHPAVRTQYSNLEFLSPATPNHDLLRDECEQGLFTLVSAVIERTQKLPEGTDLKEIWSRVIASLGDDDEREYCKMAGRLGLNPYDPENEDVSAFADGLSHHLFSDICEAAKPTEIRAATEWARTATNNLNKFPEIDISQFGAVQSRTPQEKIWVHGYEAARTVRKRLGLEDKNSREVVDAIFGPAVRGDSETATANSSALEAIAKRENNSLRVALPHMSARLRRSRLCRASYLAWKRVEADSSAVTTATTLDQQASRAFAAELLAPAEQLKELAGLHGLTPEKIDTFAEANICPEQTIIWQAHNHNVPMRGVALPK
jgi:hypothetical protein